MRYLHLFHPEGFRLWLEVTQGRKVAHLLHVPTLERSRITLAEIERQFRQGLAVEMEPRRGTITQLTDSMRQARAHGARFPAAFCKRALAQLRAER